MLKTDVELVKLHVKHGLFSHKNAEAFVNSLSSAEKDGLLEVLPEIFIEGEEKKLGHPLCRGRYIGTK